MAGMVSSSAHVEPRASRTVVAQLLRFCVVGVSNTLVSLVAFAALLHIGLHYLVASVLAFAAGAVNGYVLNRLWTFRAASTWRSRTLYVGVQLFGVALNAALLWVLVDRTGLSPLQGQVCALPLVTLATFGLSRQIVFRPSSSRGDNGSDASAMDAPA
jgi:putative flippase GtrA